MTLNRYRTITLTTAALLHGPACVLAATDPGLADSRFALSELIPMSAQGRAIIALDLNWDGWLDLASVIEEPAGISVWLREGREGFGPERFFALTGSEVRMGLDLTPGDFDGDGDHDFGVLYSKQGSLDSRGVRMLMNDGAGGFLNGADADGADRGLFLASGDFEGNGRDEIVMTGIIETRLRLMELLPDGSAAVTIIIEELAANDLRPTTADFDGDGDDEILLTRNLIDREPGGVWTQELITVIGQSTITDKAVADLNGDGLPDIVYLRRQNSSDSRTVMLNDSEGGFVPFLPSSESLQTGGAKNPVLGDVDRDGFPDFVIYDGESEGVRLHLGQGDGSFRDEWGYSVGGFGNFHPLEIADLDGDGYAEILGTQDSRIRVIPGRPGGLGSAPRRPHTRNSGLVGIGDVDGDGDNDLAVIGGSSEVRVLMNENGRFRTFADVFPYLPPQSGGVVADVDGDGLAEVVTLSPSQAELVVTGFVLDGLVAVERRFPLGPNAQAIAASDLDLDGHIDMVIYDEDEESVSVLRGLAGGAFEPRVVIPVPSRRTSNLLLGDLDGDGDDDLVLLKETESEVVLLRNVAGVLSQYQTFEIGALPDRPVLIDADGDGDLDLFITYQSIAQPGFYLNSGDGVFKGFQPFDATPQDTAIGATDLTGDGRPELLLRIRFGMMGYDLTASPPTPVFSEQIVGLLSGTIQRADLDGDGDEELLLSEFERHSQDFPVVIIESLEADPRPCAAADLAFPFGVLDISDVAQYIGLFVLGERTADFVPPFQVLDLADVVAFIESFAAGCGTSAP